MASDQDRLMAEILRKIDREEALMRAASAMQRATKNRVVQAKADQSISEGLKYIKYLEEELRTLQLQMQPSGPPPPQHGGREHYSQQPGGNMMRSPVPTPPPKDQNGRPYGGEDHGGYGDPGPGGYSQGGTSTMPPRAIFADPQSLQSVPKARPNFSKLDLIKYDTPYLGPKIQLMLSQLEFKLSVEKQYKAGIEKMVRLYQDEGDRKSRADAEGRRIESNQKIQLLQQARKRYADLHVGIGEDDAGDDDSLNTPNMRKPLTGHLQMRIHAVRDVDHAVSSRFSRGPETFVIMKVEDNVRAKTRATRNDRWTEESFNIDIDKANEIELTVYDKSGDRPTPIGFLWVRISDIAEEMRRKKIESEFQQNGWVSADKMADGGSPGKAGVQFQPPQAHSMPPGDVAGPKSTSSPSGPQQSPNAVMIDSWFSLEPAGRIHLTMSFQKQMGARRPFDIGLNRQGAVRQKKEEVHEKQGHKFVKQQFYNVIRCALCGEFLKYAAGMQCADCKYTCHQKCYSKVVTKCISKANYETDPDEEKINHRIPHRFEDFSNIGANWCCHCGYLLPIGRKNAKKCSECGLTCHQQCAHLVPDFCGMSMIVANEILETIQRTKNHNKTSSITSSSGLSGRTLRPESRKPPVLPASASSGASLSYDAGQPQQPSRPTYDVAGFDQQPKPPSMDARSAAARSFQQPIPPGRPEAPRTSSTNDAILAASAATGRPSSAQNYPKQPLPYERQSISQPPQIASYDPSAYEKFNKPPQAPRQQQMPQPYPARTDSPRVQQQQQQQQQQHHHHHQQHQQPPAPAPAPQAQPQPPLQQALVPKPEAPPASTQGSGRRIGLDHFNFLAVLGKGNFGKVMLAETKASKQLYAIKVLKKEFIIENDEVESTKSEKRVFLIANEKRHPFLLNLHACFQTETRVYFVMEYISGGDLMLHIQRGQFGLKRAQFYAAEVCLALKYFHEHGVIYRDLKLDNILLTLDGHIKIADYGLCKEDMWYGSTTSTFCGTPEFMAPEILLDKKYGRAVDWWAFGVLIYQMLLQQSPFRGEDEDEIYDAILADEPLYPIHMPRDSVSILQKLLTREPAHRLGSGPTDAQEIMSHAFFRGVNWEDVYEKRVPPPFKPTVKNEKDTSNFDTEFTSVTPVLTPVQSVLSQAMQEEFRGFSYSADFV